MSIKGGNFFEAHIEKVVLAVAGLVCIWLLVTRVFISSNVISYDNKKFGPAGIDFYIDKQADVLKSKLDSKPKPIKPYEPQLVEFAALMNSAISDVDVSVSLLQPGISSVDVSVKAVYHIPSVDEVEDVQVVHIRAVAYVPTKEIDKQNIYSSDNSAPNDIDLVTVEAKLDVAGLHKRFQENFDGGDLKQEWRDPCLAKPVFAAVQLERQELLSDGYWSDWQTVPRARIDPYREMVKVVENVEDLPAGGIQVRLLQFSDRQVQMDLLQPESYRIASADQRWFPPSLYEKYVEYQKELDLQKKRESLAAEKEKREKEREDRIRRKAQTTTASQTETSVGGKYGASPSKYGAAGANNVNKDARVQQRKDIRRNGKERSEDSSKKITLSDITTEFDKILITEKTNFSKMDKPLVFWAYDDTAEPGRSYRYRIRLGVFNPIAGTDKFSEEDKSLRNDVILWSKFSDVTETVEIPAMLYFFPRQIQEAAKLVTATISRYVLGYWYSNDFVARPGEVLGKVVEYEATETEAKQQGILLPKVIDYSTGALLVDAVAVNDWCGGRNMRSRYYFDMLYSLDSSDIRHLPIDPRYWSKELQAKYNEIRQLEKEPKKPLQAWTDLYRRGEAISRPGQIPTLPGQMPNKYDRSNKYKR